MKNTLLLLVSFLSLTISAYGHPTGHDGHILDTAWHVITQPNHLLMIGLGLVLALIVVRFIFRAGKKES